MANVSDVTVRIEAHKCGGQVKKWLELVDKDAWYDICTDHTGEQEGDTLVFIGSANGRWDYVTNLKALSDSPTKREEWCSNPEVEDAYQQIIKRIGQDHEASVVIDYTDCEIGMEVFYRGELVIEWDEDEGKVITYSGTEDIEYTPENLIEEHYADDLREALEYMGVPEEELDEAVREYQEKKGKEGK